MTAPIEVPSVIRTPLMLEDSLISQDVEANWSIFENAFSSLSEDDFTLEDHVMSLTMKDDDDFKAILNASLLYVLILLQNIFLVYVF